MASNAYMRGKLRGRKEWSRKAHAAKARRREVSMADAPGWRRVLTMVLTVEAAPDGKHVEIHAHGRDGRWVRCGSERAVRAALARLLWDGRGTP